MQKSRRDFIKKTSAGAVALSFGGILPAFSANSYRNIIGANEKITVACMGVNSRGLAVGKNFAAQKNCEVLHVCDVDSRAAATWPFPAQPRREEKRHWLAVPRGRALRMN